MLRAFLVICCSLFISFLALADGVLPANLKMITEKVEATSGLTCDAYLYLARGAKPKSVYFQIFGTGIYSNGSFAATYITRHKSVMNKINSGEMALLMYDKPGLHNNPNDKTKTGDDPILDKKAFLKYTFTDLQACTKNVTDWADSVLNFRQIIFAGHSEGSVVSVNFITDLYIHPTALTPKLRAVFLSGIAMGNLKDLFLDQIARGAVKETKENFLYQIDHCTDESEYLYGGDSSCKWLNNAFQWPSMRENLEKLWTIPQATKVNFQAFLGIDDIYTPWAPVADFDRANIARATNKLSSLDWSARYYVGGHNDGSSSSFQDDYDRALTSVIARQH